MSRFATPTEAKQFLIDEIEQQARRDGVSLTEVERSMLYFSETDSTLPDIAEVNEEFDQQFDQSEYEKKIGQLIRNALKHARKQSKESRAVWSDAIRLLRNEDHYLLVMLEIAGA